MNAGGKLSTELLDAAVELMGRSGRGGTVRVSGRSMVPTLFDRQLLAVEFAPETIRTGDIIVFRQNGRLVVHRYLSRGRDASGRPYLRMRGDGVPRLDPPVSPEGVVGRVVAIAEGERWRTVRSFPARVYGRALALHDRAWALGGTLIDWVDRGFRKLFGWKPGLREALGRVDAGLLSVAHLLLFRPIHRFVPEPEVARGPALDDPCYTDPPSRQA